MITVSHPTSSCVVVEVVVEVGVGLLQNLMYDLCFLAFWTIPLSTL